VNCEPRSILLHCYYRLPFTRFIYILANYYFLPLDTLNPLFIANREIDNLTVSCGKVLGCVVCRFHVAAGAKLSPRRGAIYKLSGAVAKLASINLRKLVLSPTGSINLGFILREDLLMCSSYLPLGVPNCAVIYTPSWTQILIFLKQLIGFARVFMHLEIPTCQLWSTSCSMSPSLPATSGLLSWMPIGLIILMIGDPRGIWSVLWS
jgi:hypothetical protein